MSVYIQKKFMLLVLALLLAITLSGCAQVEIPGAEMQLSETAIQFTDDDGRKILLDSPCTRIISLYSAHTENLFSLGAGAMLIGDHHTSTYPPDTQKIPNYDYNDDPETIIAAEPDLVLIRPYITRRVPGFVQAIEMAGIPVVSLYPEKFAGFKDYISKLALLTGTEDAATEQLDLFYRNLEEIMALTKNRANKQNVFFEATEVNLRTITEDSMPAIAIAFAGGINIAAGAKPIQEKTLLLLSRRAHLALADEIDVYVAQRVP